MRHPPCLFRTTTGVLGCLCMYGAHHRDCTEVKAAVCNLDVAPRWQGFCGNNPLHFRVWPQYSKGYVMRPTPVWGARGGR